MTASFPTVPLHQVLRHVERRTAPVPGTRYRQVGVRLWGQGAYERESIDGSETKYAALFRVETDDVIVNKIWARNGSVAVIPLDLAGCYASGEFPVFAVRTEDLDPRWLGWMTRTKPFWEACDLKSRGTSGKNRIRTEKFLQIQIPLPSLSEQRRIVARIEELAAKIEEARGLRQDATAMMQNVLGAAATQMLKQLDGSSVPIGSVAEVRGGIQKGPHRTAGENPVRYLTVAHVHRNHISLIDPRFFEVPPQELERWRLLPGDVLVIEGNGSADEVGRTALFRGEIGICVHQNHVIRIRPEKKTIDPEFLNLYLNSPPGKKEIQSRSRTTSGLRNLSVGRIKEIEVPLPPLDEQHRIVAYIDGLQAKLNGLNRLQAETAAELEALLPAVLDRAFKGELYGLT